MYGLLVCLSGHLCWIPLYDQLIRTGLKEEYCQGWKTCIHAVVLIVQHRVSQLDKLCYSVYSNRWHPMRMQVTKYNSSKIQPSLSSSIVTYFRTSQYQVKGLYVTCTTPCTILFAQRMFSLDPSYNAVTHWKPVEVNPLV